MNTVVLNNREFQEKVIQIYKEEQFKILEEKWNKLSKSDKIFVVEILKKTNKKKNNLNEAKWYNTLMDIVGVFDPSGAVDAINAISYFNQGDYIFAIMSLISVFPYIGDAIAKPIIGILKYGKGAAKLIRGAKTSTQWGKLGAKFSIIRKLINQIAEIGPKLIAMIERIPGGKRFTKVVREWVEMLKKAKQAKATMVVDKTGKLTSAEVRVFRDYGIDQNWSTLWKIWKRGGFKKNRQLSRLLRKTKFYMAFLDFIDFTGTFDPYGNSSEDLAKLENGDFDEDFEKYMKTPEAQAAWNSEMSQIPDQPVQQTSQPQAAATATPKSTISQDPFLGLFFS